MQSDFARSAYNQFSAAALSTVLEEEKPPQKSVEEYGRLITISRSMSDQFY
jgi:hypothetical protein